MPAERLTEPSLENVPRVPSRDTEGIAQVMDVSGKDAYGGGMQSHKQLSHAGTAVHLVPAWLSGPEVRADKHSLNSGGSDFILRPVQRH